MNNEFNINFIKCLANEKRLNIIIFLFQNTRATVGEVSKKFKLPQSSTSEHISILKTNNILVDTREGNFIYYEVDRNFMIQNLDKITNYLRNCC